jgi:glycosyltransferase involved in cell wall biosynthesis
LGISARRIVRIHNGLDISRFRVDVDAKQILAELNVREADFVIGIVGNIKIWKGQETVVRATALLKERFPTLKCLLVGGVAEGDEEYFRSVQRLIQDCGIGDRVILTQYQSNVANFINVMDVVIHASVDPEPFGRVFLEAMALKKAVIGTNIGAAPEIVLHGRTGLLVPPGDAETLAAAITELLEDERRRHDWGEAGYARLLKHFGIAENVAATEALYSSITQE